MPAPDLSRPRPKPKSSTAKAKKDASGLGRAIINRRAKEQKRIYDEALHNTELPSGLNSVTQENDLDEFLNTAQLAATDFSAERQNIRVLPSNSVIQQNPYLLTDQEERELKTRHASNRKRLRVPRRPAWSRDMAKEDLERNEREDFLEWRKGLADMEDRESFLLTPFERNLAVWRQLWRTLERSHLVVQIVDARNPLGFRCEDLETYVKEVGTEGDGDTVPGPGKRRSLLLVNKADLLTPLQREQWAAYFEQLGIHFAFFSAKVAVELQEQEEQATNGAETSDDEDESEDAETDEEDIEEEDEEEADEDAEVQPEAGPSSPRLPTVKPEAAHAHDDDNAEQGDDGPGADDDDDSHLQGQEQLFDRTQVLTVEQLEELFLQLSPDLEDFASEGQPAPKFCVGLVGYPNVGKSSTINALVGQKKVSVSSTPGKTKNFQTIHLSPEIVLCDCPGLVFPQFATTKAGMVCDGVLPIDQMREHTAPVELVTHRIPKSVLEGIYGLRIPILPISEGGTGIPTASEFLSVYAVARGFFTSGQGNPDESRASRYILKDYVNAKLLYCHPPPGADADAFNAETRDLIKMALAEKLRQKRAPTQRVGKKSSTFLALPDDFSDEEAEVNGYTANGDGTESVAGTNMTASGRPQQSARASAIERDFFAPTNLARAYITGGGPNGTSRSMVAPHQRQLDDTGKKLSSRKMRELESLGAIVPGSTKKHFKANKRAKARSGAGYDQ